MKKILTTIVFLCVAALLIASCNTGEIPERGPRGKSAYEYAKEAGYSGSEKEFGEMLKKLAEDNSDSPEKGDKGDKGEAGSDGKSAYDYAVEAGYKGTEEDFGKALKDLASDTPLVFLPESIDIAVGRTIEIYNSQICPNSDKYHFRWNCKIGKALERKFSVTGTEALIGEHTLTLELYNDALEAVYSQEIKLNVVSSEIPEKKTILAIGDSLTNGKYWLKEVPVLSGEKITFVGTRTSNVSGTNVSHEGRSGWASSLFLKASEYTYEKEGVHPFWDTANNKFSWSYYKETTGLDPDGIQIFLGTNELGYSPTEKYIENMKKLVDLIREDDNDIPIFIVLPPTWGDQNGIGKQQSSDGFSTYTGIFKYNQDHLYISGARMLYEALKDSEGIYFVPLTQCHDSEYNYGSVEVAVNPRSEQTELVPAEAVHPTVQGYKQYADIMFSVYCKVFSK